MKSLLVATAVLSIISTSALADETLKWRHVQHAASVQTLQVGDANGHALNLYRTPGIAFLPDGSTATTLVIGTSDLVNGSGTVNGYGTITFSDGSELLTKYTGTVFPREGSKMLRKGTYIVVGGKGRYAGAKGDGTWEGDGAPIGPDAITYIDNVVNIKK
jgi:hypothetical protein